MLPIYIYGHPVLRKVAEDIDREYPGLQKLIEDMWDSMYASDGVGLAAPQIGKSIRIFVVDTAPYGEIDPECKDFRRTFINAHILERTGEEVYMSEGCLSVPGIHEEVLRSSKIKITYRDENWEEHTEEFEGMKARVIQHEYDHLEGKIFTDHLSILRKRLLKSKLNNISAGKFSADYRTVLPK